MDKMSIHDKFGGLLAFLREHPKQKRIAPQLTKLPVILDVEDGDPAFTKMDEEGFITLHFNRAHYDAPAVYLHELGHAYTLLVDSAVEPSPRAEVAAWAFVWHLLDYLPTEEAHEVRQSLSRVAMVGPLSQKLDMGFGKVAAEEYNGAYVDRLIQDVLDGCYEGALEGDA